MLIRNFKKNNTKIFFVKSLWGRMDTFSKSHQKPAETFHPIIKKQLQNFA